jgi:hypothetical protein
MFQLLAARISMADRCGILTIINCAVRMLLLPCYQLRRQDPLYKDLETRLMCELGY